MARSGIPKKISDRPVTSTGDVSSMPLLFTEQAAAAFLGVSASYLKKSRMEGRIKDRTGAPPFVRVRGRVFYRRADLEAWVAGLEARRVV